MEQHSPDAAEERDEGRNKRPAGNNPSVESPNQDNHFQELVQNMEGFLREDRFCDVVLCVGDRNISAHKVVLAAFSPYFSAMFCSPMKEKDLRTVVLHELDGQAVNDLVIYAYEGKIGIDERNVQALLKAAAILQVTKVVKMCSAFLRQQIHPSNCLGISSFAASHGCHSLQTAAEEFVEDHFAEVVKHDEFLHLSLDHTAQLLSSDCLNVEKEETVFEAMMTWLCYCPQERLKHIAKLLGCVQLPHLPPSFIVDQLLSNSWFTQDQACVAMVMDAMVYHTLPERRNKATVPLPRSATIGTLFVVGGIDSRMESMSIECYQARRKKWYRLSHSRSPQKRLQFGLTVIEDHIYVVGGRDGLRTLNTVDKYNPFTGEWSAVTSMCTPRHGVNVAALNGPIYAVGGHDGWSYLSSVERYDPDTGQWGLVCSMTFARSTAGLAVLDGKLYAVGGRDSMSCLNSAECYDPHTNKWTQLPKMAVKRGGLSLSAFNRRLYAVGGHDNNTPLDAVEVYDPSTNQWSLSCPLSCPRDACSTVIYGSRLYVIGGYNGSSYLDMMEECDEECQEWRLVSTLVAGRAGAGCAVFHLPLERVPGIVLEEGASCS